MSDHAPTPSKSGQQTNKNQVILLAVLGVALLLVLVLFVLKPFGGGDDSSAPVSTPAPAETAGVQASAPAGAPVAPVTAEPTPAPPRNRNPFDGPR